MRVTVIGAGSIGSRHARNLKALGCDVTLVDQPESKAVVVAFQLDVQSAYDSEEAVAANPDAVLICTPAKTHAAVARQLLACGYAGPLFVEKPLALSVEDAEVFRMWPHPVVQVGYNWRFNQDIAAWMKGSWRNAILRCDTDAARWPGRDYGPMLLECSHELDLAWFAGAREIDVSWGITVYGEEGQETEAEIVLRTMTGRFVEVEIGWPRPAARAYVFSGNGYGTQLRIPRQHDIEHSYVAEMRAFCESVRIRRIDSDACAVTDAIGVLGICETVKAYA